MKPLEGFLDIPDSRQSLPTDPFGRRRQWAHHTPKPSTQRNYNRFQGKPPQNPYKDYGNIPIPHRASPKRTEDKEIENQQKFLLNQPGWESQHTDVINDLERRLSNYAKWLRENAKLCLLGDFSRWPAFYEYKIHRLRADHLRLGKEEIGYVQEKDAEGNWVLAKGSIFRDKLAHIEKLKQEFYG